MPATFDPDAPWLANLLLSLAVTVLVTWGSVMVATRSQRRQTAAAQRDAAAAREQLENSHSTPFRDDLDAKVEGLSRQLVSVIDAQQTTHEAIGDVRRDIGGLRSEVRADRAEIRTNRDETSELRRRVDQLTQ